MTTKIKEMTTQELDRAAQEHDHTYNEGGEGYNPYRSEMDDRAYRKPRTRGSAEVLHEISILDCSIARECGTFNAERVAALKEEYEGLKQEEERKHEAMSPR